MNPFEEAARKAADDIVYEHGKTLFPTAQADEIEYHIVNAYADLRATYEVLTQLAIATREMFALQPMAYEANESGWLTYCEDKAALELRVYAKLANPLVQAAIERSKG